MFQFSNLLSRNDAERKSRRPSSIYRPHSPAIVVSADEPSQSNADSVSSNIRRELDQQMQRLNELLDRVESFEFDAEETDAESRPVHSLQDSFRPRVYVDEPSACNVQESLPDEPAGARASEAAVDETSIETLNINLAPEPASDLVFNSIEPVQESYVAGSFVCDTEDTTHWSLNGLDGRNSEPTLAPKNALPERAATNRFSARSTSNSAVGQISLGSRSQQPLLRPACAQPAEKSSESRPRPEVVRFQEKRKAIIDGPAFVARQERPTLVDRPSILKPRSPFRSAAASSGVVQDFSNLRVLKSDDDSEILEIRDSAAEESARRISDNANLSVPAIESPPTPLDSVSDLSKDARSEANCAAVPPLTSVLVTPTAGDAALAQAITVAVTSQESDRADVSKSVAARTRSNDTNKSLAARRTFTPPGFGLSLPPIATDRRLRPILHDRNTGRDQTPTLGGKKVSQSTGASTHDIPTRLAYSSALNILAIISGILALASLAFVAADVASW